MPKRSGASARKSWGPSIFQAMKTNVYIDAGNLYFGMLKGHPELKWLNLAAFARALLREDHEVGSVFYFTSNVKTFPHDQAAIERQNIYLQALRARGDVEIVLGHYNKNKTWLHALAAPCLDCDVSGGKRLIPVMKFEEKRTDVNIATAMLRDAYTTDAESFALVSGDSDFSAPLDLIRREIGKQVIVFNPKLRRSDLANHASFYKDIPRDLPAQCQLPDEVPVGVNGRRLHRPPAWRAAEG